MNVSIIRDMRAENYFEKERQKRLQQRKSLIRKSITWALLEMLLFYLNPKSEWLGDYSK